MAQPSQGALLSPSWLPGRALWAPRASPQSHHSFLSKQGFAQPNQILFFYSVLQELLPLEEQHR